MDSPNTRWEERRHWFAWLESSEIRMLVEDHGGFNEAAAKAMQNPRYARAFADISAQIGSDGNGHRYPIIYPDTERAFAACVLAALTDPSFDGTAP